MTLLLLSDGLTSTSIKQRRFFLHVDERNKWSTWNYTRETLNAVLKDTVIRYFLRLNWNRCIHETDCFLIYIMCSSLIQNMILSTMSAKSVTCCCYIKNENLYYEFMGNFIFYQTYISYCYNDIKWDILDLYCFYVYGLN